jgi:DNA-binding YbaB/EbfC family protein
MAKGKGMQPPPGLGAGLMDKLNQMQAEMKRVQEELAHERLTISAGGDAVQVVIDGRQRLHHITLSAEALQAALADREMLQDLLVAAVNSALEQSQTLAAERLRGLSSGLGLPSLND